MDLLEYGKTEAIKTMLALPVEPANAEFNFTRIGDHAAWLGLGWLVAKGWVAYRGDGCFRFTKDGRRLSENYLNN